MLIKLKKLILFILVLTIILSTNVMAHGGNITGWKSKDSSEVTEYNGKYYGYHNENGERHYHQVEWDEEKQKWKVINPAV